MGRMKRAIRWALFGLGVVIGGLLVLTIARNWLTFPEQKSAPPTTATLSLSIVDDVTGQPVTATVTLRRETMAGEAVGTEDGETYVGQQLDIFAPVDPNVILSVLVEAPGYQDWELQFQIKQPGTVSGPVRLQRLEQDMTTKEG